MSVQILANLHKTAIALLSLELERWQHCYWEREGRKPGRDVGGNGREGTQKKKKKKKPGIKRLIEKWREGGEQCQEVTMAGGDKE